ncbi:ATP-specific succinyl-CoA synthetase beta subunit, putative [Plasmodium berghei]|uniref:Succinate--CoA ligase [ADP-forming] subunit beta, mitochondrial n=2 Tax=Plasmodium berghei TaxID=5821 RepID=A0A509AMQ5_PLABA|nr:succinyl-CoA ligase [ADP-forming] subunit beta, putative [Plasmodium berghei ANKA]CXI51082.1 ATP-specific succinyl-CoA synthetase beta subunit, putative [Plasmodium berghei]SCL94386.1 ATP-specific succinyl-CoA synthetase beta subunit, putative [Plasmodium berghei]SCM16006.1 ATP-specific succinyl-CoA synthetase beta subunit, putative [Plasmodium berghei]SCM17802.1 ATP-specific succinyl-CoA synthetase beta subunit, putative [Plasmodium berghei]SCN26050.1 ATP-specific succinyl-CoA synthetase b|eukprot:XP_034421931.1 succinyl-CoA ligase [ADP-forming] subunit beta, putative [Plasmodium berghei ANKA]
MNALKKELKCMMMRRRNIGHNILKRGVNLSYKNIRSCQFFVEKKYLSIHEYMSIDLLRNNNIPCPQGYHAQTPEEAEEKALELQNICGDIDLVIKAQILSGGRGLGYFKENKFEGGVHICRNSMEIKDVASKMLNNTLVTKQTGPDGKKCNTVFICERFYIRKERYVAFLLDRNSDSICLLGSSVGGSSIEDISKKTPEAIYKININIKDGLTDGQSREFCEQIGFKGNELDIATNMVVNLYKIFKKYDCTLLEINPLSETNDRRVLCCDAKLNFDDNAEYRQKEIFEKRDLTQENPEELEAKKYNLNYVSLDGNIACMVNGAGLAMATLDLIVLHKGSPSNFLDVGGSATENEIAEALKIIDNNDKAKVCFINILGGIMRCDIIARGIINAAKQIKFKKPLIIRLEGTNEKEAIKIIEESKIKCIICQDMNLAAEKAVALAEIIEIAKRSNINIIVS